MQRQVRDILTVFEKVYTKSPSLALALLSQHGVKVAASKTTESGKRTTSLKQHAPQLTSPRLAEAIFNRFDFSDYKGCQVVDLYPGIGIWSAFLNHAVQPSKHILLEPRRVYSPHLTTLASVSPSFNYLEKDGESYEVFNDLVSNGTLNPKKSSPDGDVNKSLLITGTLPTGFTGRRLLHQMITSAVTQRWFMSYGRVQLLLWIPEDARQNLIPSTLAFRNKTAVLFEALTECQELAHGVVMQSKAQKIETESIRNAVEMKVDFNDPTSFARFSTMFKSPLSGYKMGDVAPALQSLSYWKMKREPPPVLIQPHDFGSFSATKAEDGSIIPSLPHTPALISFTPKRPPAILKDRDDKASHWDVFEQILRRLFITPRSPLSESLKGIQPGAVNLLETNPALKAANIADKPAVRLTTEEFYMIADAYDKWDYKRPETLYDDWQDPMARYDENKNHGV